MKKTLLTVLSILALSFCFIGCSSNKTPEVPQKNNFTGIVFEDLTLDYDGNEHTITATNVPDFAKVEYTNAGPFIDPNEYEITLSVSADGYNTFEKKAKLRIKALNFTGIVFEDLTLDYDGNEHTIVASNVPNFATVEYTSEGPYEDAGEYTIGLKVSARGYNDYMGTASLLINKINFANVEFKSETFEYDGNSHAIGVTGTLPNDVQINYSSNVDGIENSATEVGEYLITAVITHKNYNELTLTATLKIEGTDEERLMVVSNSGELYFQNAIDNNELYFYSIEEEVLKRVSGDSIKDVIKYGDNAILCVSKSLLTSSIKKIEYLNSQVNVQTLLTQSVDYIQADDSFVYFIDNSLNKSGIYKVDFSGEEPVVTCLSQGKAKYLQLNNDKLYFADGNNGYKLSSINVSGTQQTRTLVVDEKINNLVLDNGVLYYTVNNLLGDYIEKFTISNSVRRKLTSDAGQSLTVVDNKLYYVNVDKFATAMIGNGIYSVSTNQLVDNNISGQMVVEAGAQGLCSLTTDGENIYYYDVDGYKLMKYNLDTTESVNLLDGFVKPEDPTPISTGSKLVEYEGNIYYLDIWDNKTLHCYNPISKLNYRMTGEKVQDFAIINDTLYVNMVSNLVNNDTYSINLKSGKELVKINDYSAVDFVFDGEFLYYVEENAAGARTAIHKCNADGSNDSIIYNNGVTNLKFVNDKLYFIDGNKIYSLDVNTSSVTEIKVDNKSVHTTVFETDGTYLYYRDMYGVLNSKKQLSRCKLDGSEKVVLVADDIDPVSIVLANGKIYFYTDTLSGLNGLYCVSASATESTNPTLVLSTDDYYAMSIAVIENDIYFIDYFSQLQGNAHLYLLKQGSEEPILIK